ncbi:transport-related membrane protein [Gammaproteobacteria bacterium]|nr:transport-related membrane protein [Gammaproteobacteria bacterium]
MNSLVLIFVCLALGKLLATKFAKSNFGSPTDFIRSLNMLVIQVALPCLIFDKMHAQEFSKNAIFPILSPVIVLIVTAIIVVLCGLKFKWSKATIGCLILLCGTSNTSFVGIPLLRALMGEDSIGIALWVDQANLLLLFTAGLVIANFCSGTENSASFIVKNLLLYRPVQALILALILKPFPLPELITYNLSVFGGLLTPLTMIAVGASLRIPKESGIYKLFSIGLSIKLIIAPIAVYLIGYFLFKLDPTVFKISTLQSAMAPMVTATIIAVDKNLHPELANLLTGFGIPISFISVTLWSLLAF